MKIQIASVGEARPWSTSDGLKHFNSYTCHGVDESGQSIEFEMNRMQTSPPPNVGETWEGSLEEGTYRKKLKGPKKVDAVPQKPTSYDSYGGDDDRQKDIHRQTALKVAGFYAMACAQGGKLVPIETIEEWTERFVGIIERKPVVNEDTPGTPQARAIQAQVPTAKVVLTQDEQKSLWQQCVSIFGDTAEANWKAKMRELQITKPDDFTEDKGDEVFQWLNTAGQQKRVSEAVA